MSLEYADFGVTGILKTGVAAVAAFALLADCGGESSTGSDASNPSDAAAPPDEITFIITGPPVVGEGNYRIKIAGVQRDYLEETLSYEAYLAASRSIEVYHPMTDQLLDTIVVTPNCLFRADLGVYPIEAIIGIIVTDAGQALPGSRICLTTDGNRSTGDISALPFCLPGEACQDADDACTLVYAHEQPELIHLKCAPRGAALVGDSCTYGQVGPANSDNCEAGAVCVDGICRAFCSTDLSSCSAAPGPSCSLPAELEAFNTEVCL